MEKASSSGKEAIYGFAEGDELRLMLLGLKRFTKIDPYNLKTARRKVADYIIDKGQYPFWKPNMFLSTNEQKSQNNLAFLIQRESFRSYYPGPDNPVDHPFKNIPHRKITLL